MRPARSRFPGVTLEALAAAVRRSVSGAGRRRAALDDDRAGGAGAHGEAGRRRDHARRRIDRHACRDRAGRLDARCGGARVSPVAAPADGASAARTSSRARKRGTGARSSQPLLGCGCSRAALAVRRLSRRRRSRRRRTCCRSIGSSCAATSGCRRAKCWRCSSGLRGESLIWTDLDAWRRRLLASPWVRDAALRRSLPSTVEVVGRPSGSRSASAASTASCIWSTSAASIIDEYGPQYADLDLPIIDGLSRGRRRRRTMTDEARAELAARRDRGAAGEAGDRAAAVAGRRAATCTTRR